MSVISRNAAGAVKKSRVVTVRSAEATRWTALKGKMTPQQRRAALKAVASKMR